MALICDCGPADNLALCAALESVRPGDVMVAATAGHTGCAVTGDLVIGMARPVGAQVVLAGVRVASGDVVVADEDGVVVVPRERLGEVAARLPDIRAAEADMDRRVREGLRFPPFLAGG